MGNAYAANPNGMMAAATGTAMQTAAGNTNGAMMGFMGMNMAGMAGQNAMGAANAAPAGPGLYNPQPGQPEPGTIFAGAAAVPNQPVVGKACSKCGSVVTGAFCSNCGAKMEEEAPAEAPVAEETPAPETPETPAE
jgi:membrane protease subunit (stomatin/prohibitin family)